MELAGELAVLEEEEESRTLRSQHSLVHSPGEWLRSQTVRQAALGPVSCSDADLCWPLKIT